MDSNGELVYPQVVLRGTDPCDSSVGRMPRGDVARLIHQRDRIGPASDAVLSVTHDTGSQTHEIRSRHDRRDDARDRRGGRGS